MTIEEMTQETGLPDNEVTEEEDFDLEEDDTEEGEEEQISSEDQIQDDDNSVDDEDGELVVTIGDEEPEEDVESAPEWVRELRRNNRELRKENKLLKKQSSQGTADEPVKLRDKPTLAEHDYDEEAYAADIDKWYFEKKKHEQAESEKLKAKEDETKTWEGRLASYHEKKTELKAVDFDEAEEEVRGILSETQQGIIVQGADNPALVVYALGKHPAQAAKLAAIQDPIKFTVAMTKLEQSMKQKKRKRPKNADTALNSGTPSSPDGSQKKLAKLLEEGMRKGDITEYSRYKKKLEQSKS